MKRDFDIIRELLLALEAAPAGRPVTADSLPDRSADEVNYNLALLIEAGFVHGPVSKSIGRQGAPPAVAYKLGWAGHDLLDAIRPPTVWEKTKAAVARLGSVSLDVMKEIAVTIGRQELERQLRGGA